MRFDKVDVHTTIVPIDASGICRLRLRHFPSGVELTSKKYQDTQTMSKRIRDDLMAELKEKVEAL